MGLKLRRKRTDRLRDGAQICNVWPASVLVDQLFLSSQSLKIMTTPSASHSIYANRSEGPCGVSIRSLFVAFSQCCYRNVTSDCGAIHEAFSAIPVDVLSRVRSQPNHHALFGLRSVLYI